MIRWMHVFVDIPAEQHQVGLDFWSAATGWQPSSPWAGHPEFVSLEPASGTPYVHVQRIDGPARIHVDLVVAEVEAARDRLAALGAGTGDRHPWWQVMASPGGLPFCLVAERESWEVPPASAWRTGHRSRVTQVSVDAPDAQHDDELRFWQAATGWRLDAAGPPDLPHLLPVAPTALQLLVQRLGPEDNSSATRAHIDFGTDEIPTEVIRLQTLGAELVDDSHLPRWVVMRDPTGLLFCVTRQRP
jgi:Glyoxalase-like domain